MISKKDRKMKIKELKRGYKYKKNEKEKK